MSWRITIPLNNFQAYLFVFNHYFLNVKHIDVDLTKKIKCYSMWFYWSVINEYTILNNLYVPDMSTFVYVY